MLVALAKLDAYVSKTEICLWADGSALTGCHCQTLYSETMFNLFPGNSVKLDEQVGAYVAEWYFEEFIVSILWLLPAKNVFCRAKFKYLLFPNSRHRFLYWHVLPVLKWENFFFCCIMILLCSISIIVIFNSHTLIPMPLSRKWKTQNIDLRP